MLEVRMLDPEEIKSHSIVLGNILHDCVKGGASVNFMDSFMPEDAARFFEGVAGQAEAGKTVCFAAFYQKQTAGTVQLQPVSIPNQPHRADLAKMLVHRAFRGRGIGKALLLAAESYAISIGRHLITLDTVEGSEGDRLYTSAGYKKAGIVPGYALFPDGRYCDTAYFYKQLKIV